MTDFNPLENCCGCTDESYSRCCMNWVLYILSVLFAFSLGFVIGLVVTIDLAIALPALIAISVILFILVLVAVVYRICKYRRNSCNCE